MTEPYYQDESVTLFHGRCEDILPGLSLTGSVHLLTDPPYFKVKDNDWDNQWSKSAEFLDWMGDWLDLAKPHLSPDASVWVFASPELTSAVESVVASRFRVLNSVRWVKQGSMAHRMSVEAARSHVPFWEGIIFAEQIADAYGEAAFDLHGKVFAPLGQYIRTERERAGKTKKEVAAHLTGYKNINSAVANVWNWELGKNLVSEADYESMRRALGPGFLLRDHSSLAEGSNSLRQQFEELRREFEALRRPFTLTDRKRLGDIWDFASVPPYPGRHVCEKPVGLLTHMIETTTRPGDTIIDCFAGSGAVLDVARQLGRKAVGIEMDEHWCKQIAKRLSQQTFDFGDIA